MAAATAQQQKPVERQGSKSVPQKNQQKAGKNLPQAVGIAIMAVLLVVSLFVGNMRALQKVTPSSFLKQNDVASIVDDRAAAALNVETVAKRANVDSSLSSAVDSAVSEYKNAKTARTLSRADQKLMTAVSELTAGVKGLSTEDQRVLSMASDSFTEQGRFLRQEARSYNEKADKAVALYEKLPTSFLLSKPDYFEGL
ncbi:MAG: hypothetical protein IJ242_17205 [Clostridia bacterium]|nr:hypothetical protein [Clostridia bacterium]